MTGTKCDWKRTMVALAVCGALLVASGVASATAAVPGVDDDSKTTEAAALWARPCYAYVSVDPHTSATVDTNQWPYVWVTDYPDAYARVDCMIVMVRDGPATLA